MATTARAILGIVGATPAPDGEDPEIGTVIADRYRIVELLGLGGMGAVYRAEHLQLAKPVAIKVLRPEISTRRDSDQRFQREALAGARLQHPNVVGVIDFGNRDDGTLYLVMELLSGESLRKRLDKTPRLPWPQALHIARQILRGLAHAHAQGVVHRDIKPENVHLTHDGEDPDCAKLIDFGIAMLLAGEGADVKITAAGIAVGTPTYLAPEQAVGGRIGPPTDLYSLSVVLFEMLAGRPPFVADEPVRLLTAHAMNEPPPINELAPEAGVPLAVEAIVRRGLAKTWSERIGSAADYIAMIDDARRGLGMGEGSNPQASRYQTPVPGTLSTPVMSSAGHVVPQPAFPTTPLDVEKVGGAGPPSASATPLPVAFAPTAPATTMSAPSTSPWSRVAWPPSKRQLRIIAGVLGVIVLVAIIVAIASGGDGKTVTPGKSVKPGGGSPVIIAPVIVPSPADKENAFKAALHDLQEGKTCADRKRAVVKLRELGDARAVPPLKKARSRMRGGLLGIGDSNTNACLKKEAEATIKALGGDLK